MFRLSFSGQPYWNFSDLGIIWKVLADDSSGLIALECRNPETKAVTLVVLNPARPEQKPEFHSLEQGKMRHLVDFWENVLLLEDFENDQVPQSNGLIALGYPGFIHLWSRPNHRLGGLGDSKLQILMSGSDPGGTQVLNLRTGEPEAENDTFENEEKLTRQRRLENRIYPKISMPGDAENNGLVKNLSVYAITLFPKGPVSYALKGDVGLYAYYRANAGKNPDLEFAMFKNHKKVYSICLDENAEKLNPEPFFVFGEFVITMKDKTQFMAIRSEG